MPDVLYNIEFTMPLLNISIFYDTVSKNYFSTPHE